MRSIHSAAIVLGVVSALSWGCEPTSVTAAREQLGRVPTDTVGFQVPIVSESFALSKFLPADTVTTASGLLGLNVQSDSVTVNVGQQLSFGSISLEQFSLTFDTMLQTSQVSTFETIVFPSAELDFEAAAALAAPPDLNFTTPAGSQVDAATIGGGWVVRTVVNATSCSATQGASAVDGTAATIASFPATAVPAGTTLIDSISVDGVSVQPPVSVTPAVSVGACVPTSGESVSTDITFRPMTLSSVDLSNVSEGFSETYDALNAEPRMQAVDTIVASSGTLTVTAQNRLPVAVTVTLTLNGILNSFGAPLAGTFNTPAAPGDGTTTTDVIVFDLAGVRIVSGAVMPLAVGVATAASATITSALAADAAIIDVTGSLEVERLSGSLDPAQTPELTVTVEEFQTLTPADVDFDDLEDPISQSTINDATIELTVRNDANVPLVLDSVTLGVVKLDAFGALTRDLSGDPAYELDGSGNPLLVLVADTGQSFAVPQLGSATVSVGAAPLVDKMVKLLLADTSVALVAAGDVVAGDGSMSSISRADDVFVGFNVIVGLDFTLPAGGVQFTITEAGDGLGADSADIDDLVSRLISASGTARVENRTAFGMEVLVGLVPDSLADSVDVFTQPGLVTLDLLTLSPPAVDANGVPTGTTVDSVTASLTGEEARVLLGDFFTAGIRIRLLPGSGAGGRGSIRSSDEIKVSASAVVQIRRGRP